MKLTYSIFLFIICIYGCDESEIYKYKATSKCKNLELNIARLYPDEEIFFFLNNELIYKNKIADSIKGFLIEKDFCIEYSTKTIIRVLTKKNGTKFIDTTFSLTKQDFGYFINISMPHPINWKDFYSNSGVPIKEWGYLSIDSSIRIVSIFPDTIYKNTFIDKLDK